jgi:hypothetical protein
MKTPMLFKKLTLEDFTDGLKAAWGDNLVSLALYGSAARGDFSEKSDYNLLAVVRDDSPAALKPALPLARRWARQGQPAPAVFTSAKIAVSADVFPMEFMDIRDHRKVLHGTDPLADLSVQPKNLRRQLEGELWQALQRLRRSYLASDGKAGTLSDLMTDALPGLLVLFRHVLRLHGEAPPARRADVLGPLSKKLGVDLSSFERDGRPGVERRRMTDQGMEQLFARYLAALDRVAAAVNALP